MTRFIRDYCRVLVLSLLTACCVSLPAHAVPDEPAPVLQPGVPMKYVVKKGDTLWDIAAYFLRDPWLWPEIWFINSEIRNPHLIYPGDVLYLVWRDGKPMLMRKPLVKLGPQIHETPLDSAIPTIPLADIRAFLRGPRLVGREELNKAPYVVDFQEEHLIGGPFDPFYARHRYEDEGLEEYTVVRESQVFRDPDNNEVIGVEVIQVTDAEIIEPGESIFKLHPMTPLREVNKGDYLLPIEELQIEDPYFTPRAPEAVIAGQVISVHDGNSHVGQFHIVTLNKGSEDGLAPGHVLDIRRPVRMVDDPRPTLTRKGPPQGPARRPGVTGRQVALPEEISGQMMIFKTYDRISYGLVMTSIRHIKVGDVVRNPLPSS